MTPYTRADAEADLATALDVGDQTAALQAAIWLDRMPARRPASISGAALWYAGQGLPVFPIQAGGKKPRRGTHGLHDATTDPDIIRGWWAELADSNLAIATGHRVDVIDFDGAEAHAAWGRQFPGSWADHEVTILGTVSTPRPGGLHIYVPALGGGNRAGMLPGVDYRGLGGYVLVPPSRLDDRPGQHPGTYRFLRPLDLP